MVMVQEQLTGEVRPDVTKNGQISPFGRRAGCQDCGQSSAPPGLARTRKKRKNSRSGVIWGIRYKSVGRYETR
jgi:hypothetical protein